MPHTDSLDGAALDLIAGQVAALYPYVAGERERFARDVDLAETFQVWMLAAEDVQWGWREIADVALDTLHWHAQIRVDGEAHLYARFMPRDDEPAGWAVTQISTGDLAGALDMAVGWIDENVRSDDPRVRILEAPGYQMTFLWLQFENGESRLLPVWIPEDARALRSGRLYGAEELLNALRDEEVIDGIEAG